MKFLIESKYSFGRQVPAQDFGYTYLEVADYHNWRDPNSMDEAIFCLDTKFSAECLQADCVPVGSIQFCKAWYVQIGVKKMPPLNIPKSLWPLVKREIFISKHIVPNGKRYFGKDPDIIKAPWNGIYSKYQGKPMFFTEWRPDIVSEWRLFVLRGEIVGAKCYLGDPWIHPDKAYCKKAAHKYGEENSSFTLDVMVQEKGETDILELHDFVACGLYGFGDVVALRQMSVLTQRKLLQTTWETPETNIFLWIGHFVPNVVGQQIGLRQIEESEIQDARIRAESVGMKRNPSSMDK